MYNWFIVYLYGIAPTFLICIILINKHLRKGYDFNLDDIFVLLLSLVFWPLFIIYLIVKWLIDNSSKITIIKGFK